MSQIKIAFFDIDGTLIDMEKKQITPVTLEVLHRLQANGIRICLATGRSPMVVPHFEGVAFDATLTYNGSYCYTKTGETIFSNPIPAPDLALIIRNATAIARPLCLATSSRLACNGCDKDLADYFAIAKSVANIAPDFDEVAKGTVYQIMMGGRADEYAAILKDVQGAKIAAWWDRAVDIIPATGGKGIGIRKMLEYYGLDKSEAIAFGDGNNDIEMLQAVGTGVAMENASEKLKAVATDHCGHVANEGVYQYCVEHGLI